MEACILSPTNKIQLVENSANSLSQDAEVSVNQLKAEFFSYSKKNDKKKKLMLLVFKINTLYCEV